MPTRWACRAALFALTAAWAAAPAAAPAQVAVDPASYGFDIPPGVAEPGEDQRVVTDDDGTPVVAKVLANIGEHRVVLLPDGELVARAKTAAPLTDRRFEPVDQDDLMRELQEKFGPGFKSRKTRNYIYIYNTSDNFATGTSRILESMRPGVKGYVQRLGVPTHEPEVPLVAIMFRTYPEFQRFRRMPEGVIAYYNTLTNFIVMYEESELSRVRPALAIQQSISTIAHEGAHQILHNIGVQHRLSSWPMWLSEGLAEFFAPTTFGARMKWKGAGQVNDLRMLELEIYLKSRSAERTMIGETVAAARLTSTGYASAWSLTHFLAKRQRSEFAAYLREISLLEPFEGNQEVVAPGVIPENVTLFKKHFGEDLAELEDRLVAHLERQPYTDPFADLPHYVATIAVRDGRRVMRDANVFHTTQLAAIWIDESLKKLPDDQRADAQTQIVATRNRLFAEQTARQFLSGRLR